jgi:hypothetical protein
LRAVNPEALQCALSRARPGHLCFSVDKDLHGCRLLVSNQVVISELPVIRPEPSKFRITVAKPTGYYMLDKPTLRVLNSRICEEKEH